MVQVGGRCGSRAFVPVEIIADFDSDDTGRRIYELPDGTRGWLVTHDVAGRILDPRTVPPRQRSSHLMPGIFPGLGIELVAAAKGIMKRRLIKRPVRPKILPLILRTAEHLRIAIEVRIERPRCGFVHA